MSSLEFRGVDNGANNCEGMLYGKNPRHGHTGLRKEILGLLPHDLRPDIARIVLRRMKGE